MLLEETETAKPIMENETAPSPRNPPRFGLFDSLKSRLDFLLHAAMSGSTGFASLNSHKGRNYGPEDVKCHLYSASTAELG